ncbi:hypothetical protein TIFTF001_043127 [Ficus carica]|uniref:Uncharacterized protein n=1 Tax=Ficus carica TaxID=3494 RepID=A0AA88CL84_FICCA|nr:hypothetical protein TIFTF001_043127 [Ficus carica]
MYGVNPAWEVGASQSWYQSGILPAYFTSPHIVSATAQKENVGHEDNVGWCLSLVVASRVPSAPVNQPAAPEIPDVDPVIPENPIAPEVPVAPVAVPPAPLVRTLEELYDRFRCMKAPEFEGSTNPIEADKWLIDLQIALNFLRLNDREKVLCTSFMLRKDARLW